MCLKEILSLINKDQHFKRFPSFVLIILMTMGTHHDIILYLMGYVKLTYRQRKRLILARLQLQVYFMLTKNKNSPHDYAMANLILRNNRLLGKFLIGSYQFHPFNVRVCNQMISACESIRSYLWSKQYMNLFECDRIFMPSLTEIRSIMTQVSNERLFRFFEMNDIERHLLKSAIIFQEMLTLLKKNETVVSFLTDPRNKRAPEKFFRIWKEIMYVGDSSGNPDSLGLGLDYQRIRLWQDVIFIWVLFLSLDPNFEMTLREYIDSDVPSYSPYSMATSTSEKMRDIFFSLSTDVKTFDFEGLMNGTQYDFLDFLRFIYDRRYRRDYYSFLGRGRLFHYVLVTKNPRTFLLVNNKSLESENILERFQMCLNLFLENLPPDLEQFFQTKISRFGM
jgi:hypothetical protein